MDRDTSEACPQSRAARSAAVIGCGIAGLSTALYLAERGYSVTCIDRHETVAHETSYMNGALLVPSLTYPWANAATLRNVALEMLFPLGPAEKRYINIDRKLILSLDFLQFGINFAKHSLVSERFLANYKASYGLAMLTQRCMLEQNFAMDKSNVIGSLQLFSSVPDRETYLGVQRLVVPDVTVHLPEDASRFEPSLNDPLRFAGGFIYSDLDRTMDSYKLCQIIKTRAESLGVKFLLGKSVTGFSTLRNKAADVLDTTISSMSLDDGSILSADIYIAANGNNSNDIAEWAGDGRHSWPIRGFVLDVPTAADVEPLRHAIVDDVRKVYIAPLGRNRVRISGLCDVKDLAASSQLSTAEHMEKCGHLLSQAKALMPDNFFVQPSRILFQSPFYSNIYGNYLLKENTDKVSSMVESEVTTANVTVNEDTAVLHTCLRPQTADDLPVIGQSGNITNLYYNSGHGHLGLTRGMGSAKVLVGIIMKDKLDSDDSLKNVALFSPGRFKLF